MQEWGPDEERLDMSHYSKEFVEFIGELSGSRKSVDINIYAESKEEPALE